VIASTRKWHLSLATNRNAQPAQSCLVFQTTLTSDLNNEDSLRVMGVHSLTTYLREKRRYLSSSITFSNREHVDDPENLTGRVNIVVDGWS
jgi:hypothetical protein